MEVHFPFYFSWPRYQEIFIFCNMAESVFVVVCALKVHTKAYFISSARALPLLLRILRRGRSPLPAIALNILWALAYNHQRAIPALRRVGALNVIRASAEALRVNLQSSLLGTV